MAFTLPDGADPWLDPHGAELVHALPDRGSGAVPMPADVTCIFIVFSNRSGSNYLAQLLASTNFFPLAQEPFNADTVLATCRARGLFSFAAYVATHIAETAGNGHFVAKISPGQLGVLAWYGILDRILDRSRFILVERIDKLAQAISWQIAAQTRRFSSYDAPIDAAPPVFDADVIRNDLEGLIGLHARAALMFALNGIVPWHVTFETMMAHPRRVGGDLCAWLGLPDLVCDPGQIGLRRQTTERNFDWRRRFIDAQQSPPHLL